MTMPLRPAPRTLSLLALAFAVCAPGAAQTATLVEDVAAQELPLFPFVEDFHPIGQSLFFLNHDPTAGEEPWSTDGTVPGTRMLGDICPDECYGIETEVLGTLGGRLVWLEGQMWSTDGTPAGTTRLTDPPLQIGDSYTSGSVRLGDRIYFKACQGSGFETKCGVWSTDGTRAGTGPVPLLTPNPELEIVSDLVAAAGRVYYVATDRSRSEPSEIWAADAAGARRLLELPDVRYSIWTALGNLLFYTVGLDDEAQLWVTDGTPAGTRSVGTFAGGLRTWLSTGPGGLYFVADDVVHGEEIWRSDGTPQGTRRVTEIGYFEPFYLFGFDEGQEGWAFEIDGRLLFAADDRLTGRRLWTSAGTPESTKAVGQSALGSRLYRAGNRLFAFRWDEKEQDCEVWSFDSKGAGTRLVDRLAVENCGPDSYWDNVNLVTAGSRAYFSAQEGPATWSVWRSDGTANGTVRLLTYPSWIGDIAVTAGERSVYVGGGKGLWIWSARDGARQLLGGGLRNASSFPGDLASHQGKLFFTAGNGTDQNEKTIWSSQGSEADTAPVLGPAAAGCPDSGRLVSVQSSLVYVCDLYIEDDELRSADPAGGGSTLLAGGLPDELILLEHEGRVWFARRPDGQDYGQEIWTSDGTPAGTTRLTDAGGNPIEALHSEGILPPSPWALSGGQLVYFRGTRLSDQVSRIWRSDGTPAGTIPLLPITSGWAFEVATAGSATLINEGGRIWRTDGTAAGTAPLSLPNGQPLFEASQLLTAHGGAFYLYASHAGRTTLWRTDGTVNGIAVLVPPFDWPFSAYNERFPIPRPVSLGGKLFFVAADPEHGVELWATDGTPGGTALVADISPGATGSVPSGLLAAGGAVWFTAHDPVHGRELWRTDGTAAGTRLVQDIAPEGRSSAPGQLVEAGGRLYFSADDGLYGRELWSLPLAGAGSCQPSATVLCLQGGRFRVESRWRDFQGKGGVGKAAPLTGDTGAFWFFDDGNVEVLLKVLDGRGSNEHFWVFYGALSSVEYSLTVTDTQTGLSRRYSNPAGQLASAGDTQGFGPKGARSVEPDLFVAPPSPPALVRGWSSAAAAAPCVPAAERLCLGGGRFAIQVSWKDFQDKEGKGTAVPSTSDTGYFWFFDDANVELAVKVLDGRELNGRFWVFYGALSNVEYTIQVTDTQTGTVKEYRNPRGRFASVGDTKAF